MKKALGFTSFEFYFVMSVVGIIMLVAIQRYLQLAEDTKRFSFEVVAKHFSAAVYNHHARWIVTQQHSKARRLDVEDMAVEDMAVQFTSEGWPLAIVTEKPLAPAVTAPAVTVAGCLSLWHNLLQNPPSVSYEGGSPYGSRMYHLVLLPDIGCRFALVTEPAHEFYFDYMPFLGQIIFHSPAIAKNN